MITSAISMPSMKDSRAWSRSKPPRMTWPFSRCSTQRPLSSAADFSSKGLANWGSARRAPATRRSSQPRRGRHVGSNSTSTGHAHCAHPPYHTLWFRASLVRTLPASFQGMLKSFCQSVELMFSRNLGKSHAWPSLCVELSSRCRCA